MSVDVMVVTRVLAKDDVLVVVLVVLMVCSMAVSMVAYLVD